MATKLNTRATKKDRRVPDSKRMTFDHGQAKVGGSDRNPRMTKKE